jgi:hypothetical protein
MPIFPVLGPQYYDEKDRPILSKMEASYSQAISILQAFWGEADLDYRYLAGDQTLWQNTFGNVPFNGKKQFFFNRILRIKNMIGGHQRRNRKSTIVVPIENGDDETADQFTKVMAWLNNTENIYDTISQSFDGALITGMNLLQVWVDYRNDPISGDIKVDNCNYNTFIIDPFFKKHDLSDCNYIWKRNYLTKRDVIALMPDHEEEIMSLTALNQRDGKFQFIPEQYNYNISNLMSYDEYYYKDYREARMLIDTQTGESTEWKSNDEEGLQRFLKQYPQLTIIKQDIATVKLAIVVQGKVMYDGPQPAGIDCYPFVPTLCYYYPDLPYFQYRCQGIVRALRDSQYLYNRRRTIELDILESQINSGWKFKENALVNPEHVFLEGQGRGLALKEEASMSDVEKIQPAQIPPSMIQLSELLGKEISEISGVNEELLGSANDDKAGILSMLRQGAGLTTLQMLFDQLDFTQKTLGKIILKIVQNNFVPGKIKRIIGEEPTDQFYNKTFGRYDAAIEEGMNTTTQKQMQFAQLMHLKEMGIPIPDSVIIEAATLQDKKKLIEAIEQQNQQAQQEQQRQLELEAENMAAQAKLVNAQAAANEGLGLERLSRIEENHELAVERKAEAIKDRELGLLHLVQAMKEIESVDLEQLEKIISLSRMVRQEEQESANVPAPHPSAVQNLVSSALKHQAAAAGQPLKGSMPQTGEQNIEPTMQDNQLSALQGI